MELTPKSNDDEKKKFQKEVEVKIESKIKKEQKPSLKKVKIKKETFEKDLRPRKAF